ncbi:MAG: molecular chaperone HtpG [Candidatus Cloacimonadota bacterium]|nr:MAG: molecular chaperone HtpG [Candidatus Cloacimonadota bacterium]
MSEEGKISVTAEDMLPIIKKWLYSEHDIFIRELVSNASDAISKHKHLSLLGESDQKDIDYKIEIAINETEKTIHIKDNGLGLNGEEVKKYIAQLAFSGAQEFFEKHKGNDDSNQVIGKFGLGFYSAFMVAGTVEVKSQSHRLDEKSIVWKCDGSTSYTLDTLDSLKTQGTEIILHMNEDSEEFLNVDNFKTTLKKYSEFIHTPLFLNGEQVNTQKAIWNLQPSTLEQEDYDKFYEHMFPMQEKPLFHLHFNVDTPFQLKGILYFQKVKPQYESLKGRIKLFCNQVFVSDAIEDVFPSYLFMLQGVLDCPDIPLNVSRSSLQGDPQIKRISQHIVKKIADKLKDLYKEDRATYETFWPDISPFVKFGMMQDEKFYKRIASSVIFKSTLDDKYTTLDEYLERNKDKHEKKVYYVSDLDAQHSYLELFKEQNLEAILLNDPLDNHLVQHLEMKNEGVAFTRIDSDLDDILVDKEKDSTILDSEDKTKEDKIKALFESAIGSDKISVRVENLKSDKMSGMILLPEQMRRFQEMSMFNNNKEMDLLESHTYVVNAQNSIVDKALNMHKSDDAKMVCRHLYDLALLEQKPFEGKKMSEFVSRSTEILSLLA